MSKLFLVIMLVTQIISQIFLYISTGQVPVWKQLLIPSVCVLCVFFFFFRSAFQPAKCFFSGLCSLFTESTNFIFNKIFIKNESHGTIYTFKNYFVIVFLVFSKISGIQTDLNIINLKMCKLLCHLKFQ